MPLITVRNLGGIGRFGNQCFLYMFARAYAERYGAELRTSDWIGRKIFCDVKERLVTQENLLQTELDSNTQRPLDRYFGRTDIDLRVYAQHQVYADFYTRKQAREWLKLKPEYERFAPAVPQNVAHLRRGDYVDNASFQHIYCSVSDQSYDVAISRFRIPSPVLRVFEGWQKDAPPLKGLPAELSWLPDFLLMRDAPHLLRANSTFSFWAGALGHGKVYSPLVYARVGLQDCEFVEGNHACTAGRFHNQSDLYLKEE